MTTRPSGRPLLTASMIVRDEAEVIRRCLASLQGVVDEVVVLDTGSTDGTPDICRSMGAEVHLGTWHDDFARARNEALARCRGRWVLQVDADEELVVADAAAVRRQLARSTADAHTTRIHNIQDATGLVLVTHEPVRLFRRGRFRFEGRIHEKPVPLGGRRATATGLPALQIRHHGYVREVIAARGKVERNVRLAEAAWRAEPESATARLELARILSTTDRVEETLAHLDAVLADDGAPAHVRHTALHLCAQLHMRRGRLDAALARLDEVTAVGPETALGATLRAEALTALGRVEEALAVLEAAPDDARGPGVHGNRWSATPAEVLRGRLLAVLDREDEALEVLLPIAHDAAVDLWPPLLGMLQRRGEVARAVQPFIVGLALGDARVRAVVAELGRHDVALGDALAEALADDGRALPYALAFVALNAERLPLERAVRWSGVARRAGAPDTCPLLRQADADDLPPQQRILAAAIAAGTYDDHRGRVGLRRALQRLEDDEVLPTTYAVAEVAPALLAEVVTGYVTTQRRATVMGTALTRLGAVEQAVAVLQYGLQECDPDPAAGADIDRALAELQAA
jgi:tetratricopeptide (TPR) repeat protein